MTTLTATNEWRMNKPVDLIKVAIVDDNKATLNSMQEVLTYYPKTQVVLTAKSGTDFLEKMKRLASNVLPDVVLMDVNMPEMNGIEAVRAGKAMYPQIQFLMLTVFDDEETLFEAIRAGATGYLLKSEKSNVIISHIESMMEAGSSPMSPKIARKTLDLLATSTKPVAGAQVVELNMLSAREKDVLYLLVDGLEYKEISEKLFISPHTVRKHISNIYDKLHISSKAQAIRLMQGSRASTTTSSSSTSKHKILLVDDHEMILDSLSMMVSTFQDMEVIGKIKDPNDVLHFLEKNKADLLITDFNMPHMNGLQLSRQVTEKFPGTRILVLSVSESPEQILEAKQTGVDGYIFKKANKEELSHAIRTILEGNQYFSNPTT